MSRPKSARAHGRWVARILRVVVLVAMPCAVATGQVDDWGAPVDGVQLRLAASKTGAPYLPGELPALEVQLRNRGEQTATYQFEAVAIPHIEIDGVWYGQIWAGSCCSGPRGIAPGAAGDVLQLRIVLANVFTLDAKPARALQLKAGRHEIRVRTVASSNFDVHTLDHTGLILVSNTITVDVPALVPADERQALVEQASKGDANGFPAAKRLVEKYPDAAIPAIASAVNAARDASLRSEYVRVAGTVPGDRAVEFLLSQLSPDVGLLSQVFAADALLTRGRTDWLLAIITAWEDIQRRAPLRFDNSQNVALVIWLLAKSGHVDAISALAKDAEAPIDTRLAVVQAFLPPAVDSSTRGGSATGSSVTMMLPLGMKALPDGPAGAAIERLLDAALIDKGQRMGLTVRDGTTSYVDPRVCDMAAFVFATRWPNKYRFTWPARLEERDAEIATIRKAR